MITITNLSKNYDKRMLLDKVSLSINRGEKIGLIGPNGTGKTTLFSIILGEVEQSSGNIGIHKNIHIGYLPQEAQFDSQHTVIEELTEGDERINKLKIELHELEEKNETQSHRYGEVQHSLEAMGIFELEHKAKKIAAGLGFKERDFSRPINNLSGGWKMRTLLAKLLIYNYDLLLLDEPTNHLDLNAALWLKDYLSRFSGTMVVVSHDKIFLNEVTNYTLVLEQGKLTKIKGNYEQYERSKEEKLIFLGKQSKEVDKKRKQLEEFVQRFHAQPNKAAAVRAKRTAMERLPEITLTKDRRSIRDFEFPQTKRSGYRVVTLEKVCKSYADIQVYKDLDFEIAQNEKAVLTGENGAGKSTLLKILAGAIPIDSGLIKLGHNVEIGYFSQTRLDVLSPGNTVLNEALLAAQKTMSLEDVRSLLGVFLFRGDDVEKKVSVLSGGEKSRLILAKLLINPPNLILLDEPTTHLDIDAVEALTRAFKNYQGTLCFISHDIFFTKEIANKVFEVKDGAVRKFEGGLDYYLDKKSQERKTEQEEVDFKKEQGKAKILISKQDRVAQRQEESIHKKLDEAKRKLLETKQRLKDLEKEKKELEMESFAKSQLLSNQQIFKRPEVAKQYGQRIKEIKSRLKQIENEVEALRSILA
ncbi:MAG: ABC-F family ATP-binding cassette domain-containing protein [Candidatus Omnitrophota bacterium]|nr:ABC-F family ATP-binding cassette domain-containing protein [Candidatus Omnitrophota bacterium]